MAFDATGKKIIIIAGPNEAGKTTFARSFLPVEAHLPRFINADLIAAGLAPFAPETAAIKAGRLMLEEIETCTHRGERFVFETTLSGLAYLRHIAQWRAQGYRVSLYFLSLPDADTAIARVAERVRQGGHDIPRNSHSPSLCRRLAQLSEALPRGGGRLGFVRQYRRRTCNHRMGREPVTKQELSKARNPDLRASLAAMRRAAELARKTAIQTNTAIVLVKDGKPIRIPAEQLREKAEA